MKMQRKESQGCQSSQRMCSLGIGKAAGTAWTKFNRLKAFRVKDGGRAGKRPALSWEPAERRLGWAESAAQGKANVEPGSSAGLKGNPCRFQKRGIMGLKNLNHSMLNSLCVAKFWFTLNFMNFTHFIFTATNFKGALVFPHNPAPSPWCLYSLSCWVTTVYFFLSSQTFSTSASILTPPTSNPPACLPPTTSRPCKLWSLSFLWMDLPAPMEGVPPPVCQISPLPYSRSLLLFSPAPISTHNATISLFLKKRENWFLPSRFRSCPISLLPFAGWFLKGAELSASTPCMAYSGHPLMNPFQSGLALPCHHTTLLTPDLYAVKCKGHSHLIWALSSFLHRFPEHISPLDSGWFLPIFFKIF